MVELILTTFVALFVYMTAWWFVSLLVKRVDIADIAWGLGFVLVAVVGYYYMNNTSTKHMLGLLLVAAWGLRLAIHIFLRLRSKPEDGRYQSMRQTWKYKFLQSYTNVFLVQGALLLLVAVPIVLLMHDENPAMQWYNYLGIAIWVIGLFFEAVGDYQLTRFIKNPKNKGEVMQYGLWKYTRHPNYFGEISLWWGFYVFTLFTPYWWFGIIGPITITFLILGVSGIPMLEARYKGNKKYEAYQKTTSAFFPMPPKS